MEEKKIDPSHWSLKLPINRQVDQNANPKYLLLWGAVAAQLAFQVSEDIYKNDLYYACLANQLSVSRRNINIFCKCLLTQ